MIIRFVFGAKRIVLSPIQNQSFTARYLSVTKRNLAPPPSALLSLTSLQSEKDLALARSWLGTFTQSDIPKDSYVVTKSRSSGPGGQHVNTTESKVSVRCELGWLPRFVLSPLSRSPYYISSPPSLLISAQTSRSSSQNLASALTVLHQTIVSAAQSQIVGATSPEQKARVRGLEKKENERRLELKKRHSAKKASRRQLD